MEIAPNDQEVYYKIGNYFETNNRNLAINNYKWP